jgi:multisubunit Na+/H+ antiporter MnhF subunit
MLDIFTFFIAICMLVLLVGFVFYTELFTQILFLSSITNLGVVMIVALGSYSFNESYLDIALIYAILSFITSQAILKYIIRKNGIK